MAQKKEEERKPDVVLADGREIFFDLNRITVREWRSLFKEDQPTDEEDAILAKAAGIEPAEIEKLGHTDWRRFAGAFFKRAGDPLEDPN
jgi:hypothetical protein